MRSTVVGFSVKCLLTIGLFIFKKVSKRLRIFMSNVVTEVLARHQTLLHSFFFLQDNEFYFSLLFFLVWEGILQNFEAL